jgi:hypothetical protein
LFSPQYTGEEKVARYANFKGSLEVIDDQNTSEKVNKGTAVFVLNRLAVLSTREFHDEYLGTVAPKKASRELFKVAEVPRFHGTATSVDWTSTLTTKVKDQGGCGSCW